MRLARPDSGLQSRFSRISRMQAGEKIVIALSGGSDSVGLAILARNQAATLDVGVLFVHVNHQTRRSNGQDAAVSLAVAQRLEQPIYVHTLAPGKRDEARLRYLRYEALLDVAREYGASRILTGHTADDQTETVLLALFRGTGRDGFGGMAPERALADGLVLERPLLLFSREELRRHCERLGLPYVLDPSNADLNYRRNALRAALAALRPLFPRLDQAVSRSIDLLHQETLHPDSAGVALAVRSWLHAQGVRKDLSRERIEAVVNLVELGRGRKLQLRLEDER